MTMKTPSLPSGHRLAEGLFRVIRPMVVLAILALPAHAAAMPQAQPGLLALPNGGWRAIVSTSGPINAGGMSGVIIYNGWSQFSVVDGEVQEGGAWFLTGNSQWLGDVCSGSAVIKVDGVVTGTADMPVLEQTAAVGNATVTCAGRMQQGEFSPGGPAMTAAITWDAVTCEHATGSFALPANALVASGGASSGLVAPVDATRNEALAGADMESYSNDAAELMLDGIDFEASVEASSSVDFDALFDLVHRSEELYRDLRAVNDCNSRIAGEFMNSLRNTVARLIDTLLEHPDLFSMADLSNLARAAIETGLVGEGAPNQDMARDYENAILDEANRRLEGDEGDDCVMAAQAVSIGAALGSDSTRDAGLAAFDAACGGL